MTWVSFYPQVDHEREILESYVTKKRDKSAALAFMKKTLKRHGQADVIVTDGLRSYPAAMRDLGNLDRREMGRWLNNRCEIATSDSAGESERCSDFEG
jgi:putative transposase